MVDLLIYKPFNPFTLPNSPLSSMEKPPPPPTPVSVILYFDATVHQVWQRRPSHPLLSVCLFAWF